VGRVLVSGKIFWWSVAAVRRAFGANYFTFFYCLHRRGDAYGVYAVQLPAWALPEARASLPING
jgi:hypothetical protein